MNTEERLAQLEQRVSELERKQNPAEPGILTPDAKPVQVANQRTHPGAESEHLDLQAENQILLAEHRKLAREAHSREERGRAEFELIEGNAELRRQIRELRLALGYDKDADYGDPDA